MTIDRDFRNRLFLFIATTLLSICTLQSAAALELANIPLFLTQGAEPLVMLNMSKDHQLYFKAYDDYSDIDKDGSADTTYKNSVDYHGYFDSYKCYVYQNNRFEPAAETATKYCNAAAATGQWSGNFLNWATMTRMDSVRKILYGGLRSTDSASETVLERAYLPTDAHSFAKYYGGSDVAQLVGVTAAAGTMQTSGVTLCNTTYHASGLSQSADLLGTAPKIRVAIGNYSLWASNERWQCTWSGERGASNGNNATLSGIPAYGSSPSSGGSNSEYIARVKVCVAGLLGHENCKSYPTTGAIKPVGLLQKYGDNNQVKFGLITGSYEKNKSGGVLRKNIGYFAGEVNVAGDGSFVANSGGIVDNLNRLRIYGYRHAEGTYFDVPSADACSWARSSFPNGECSNWGNPQSEIYLEALRYLAGATATPAFSATDSTRIGGLTAPAWQDPISSANYCAAQNIIQFNASTSSYDGDDLGGANTLGISDVDAATDTVGAGENIHGHDYFVGESGSDNNQLCTAKTVGSLAGVRGTCPDAPRLEGTYKIAGLAHRAHVTSLRASPANTKKIKTYGVALAPAVPKIEIPVPGSSRKVTLLPACRNNQTDPDANCAIVDFKIVTQAMSATASTGKLYVNWEDSEQGGDYDQDMWGIIDYSVSATNVTITTQVVAQSTGDAMGFGYVLGGTSDDGFHVHSGVNNFSYAGVGTPVSFVCRSGHGSCDTAVATSRNYTLGSSLAKLLEQPLWFAAKWGGFEDADNSASPNAAGEWDGDGDGIPDTYFYSNNPAQLEASLGKALEAVIKEGGSASAVATNSTRLDNGSVIYQARFSSDGWTGQLLAYSIASGTVGAVLWDAGANGKIAAAALRKVFTYDPVAAVGRALNWANLNSTQQSALRAGAETDDIKAQQRLAWLIGARDQEQPVGNLRTRTQLLGDIVNSDPVFSGAQDFRYELLPPLTNGDPTPGRDTYQAYVTAKKARTPIIYVGANDGFVHAINTVNGEELFAYMPSGVFANAIKLTRPDYGTAANPHLYFVDGPLFLGDAYIAARGGWRTILVGSMGAGGKTLFALDVTNPTSFSASDVLFELNAADHPELGNVTGQPLVVRMADGRWAAVFGNGYNSSGGCGLLFVADLATPSSVEKIPTGSCGDNGLSGVSLLNGSGTAQYGFAGDLLGNMWKFDLTDSTVSGAGVIGWESAYKSGATPRPLFRAKDASGVYQPITAAPVLGRNPEKSNALMVYFGTGRYLATGDNLVGSTPQIQSIYGIVDGAPIATGYASRAAIPLHEKTISAQNATTRTITEGNIDWNAVKGWYLDLKNAGAANGSGERVISKPLLLFDRLVLPTLIPSSDPCSFGGSGWLLELGGVGDDDATFSLLNADGLFQEYAIPELSTFIKGGETGYLPTSNIRGVPGIVETDMPDSGGRQSWRQLR